MPRSSESLSFLPRILRIAIVCLALAPSLSAQVFTVGSDAGCDFQDFSSIYNDVPNGATIRIAKNVAPSWFPGYRPWTLEGGYDSCSDATPSGRTTLSGAGGPLPTVIVSLSGDRAGTLVLRNFRIEGGDTGGSGGGLQISGESEVILENTVVVGNRADHGGGIFITGSAASVRLDRDSTVESNTSEDDGGGIFCEQGARVALNGSTIRLNESVWHSGGGIALTTGCTLVATGGTSFHDNRTSLGAAGIYASQSTLRLTGSAGAPIVFARNEGAHPSLGRGVAVYLFLSMGEIHNARFSDHKGLSLIYTHDSDLLLDSSLGPLCDLPGQCTTFENETNRGSRLQYLVGATSGSQVAIRRVRVDDVQAASLVYGDGGSEVVVEGSTFSPSVDTCLGFGLEESHLLLANNDLLFTPSDGLIRDDDQAAGPSSVELYSSIWWGNVGVPFLDPTGRTDTVVTASCLLVEDDSELLPFDFISTEAPLFVDETAGDYHHAPGSPAIDFCDTSDWDPREADLDGQLRGWDDPDTPNALGAVDVGSDELAPTILLFADGFETGDTSAWAL